MATALRFTQPPLAFSPSNSATGQVIGASGRPTPYFHSSSSLTLDDLRRTMAGSGRSHTGHSNSPPSLEEEQLDFTFNTPDMYLDPSVMWPTSSAPYGVESQVNMTMAQHPPLQPTYPSTNHFNNYNWQRGASIQVPYNASNDNLAGPSNFTPTTYSPDSGVHTLSPYSNTHNRTLSDHISPSGSSELILSPSQAASSRLSTPTSPPSATHQNFQTPTIDGAQSILLAQPNDNNNTVSQLYTHREQLQMFRDVLSLPVGNFGPLVPQHMYKPHTNSDRKRYVEEVELEAPIYFWTDHPSECGIPLSDALHARVKRLLQRDETVFEGRGPSVSIRLEWPGYRQWSRQIPTKDFRSPPGPITRAKLAKNVAKCVQRFIDERKHQALEEEADATWKIGSNHITIDDIVLVSLHHVSLGSWQPQLRLRRPRTVPHRS